MKHKQNWGKLKLLVTSSILLILLTSCNTTSVYVLDQQELVKVKEGDTVKVKFDGWLLSQRAVTRIMNAKVEAIKLQ